MPRVFISYSQDSDEHKQRVLALTQALRADGIDAVVDQFVGNPEQGWPRWMIDELAAAQFVLLVVSDAYRKKAEGAVPRGAGKGVKWESHLTVQEIYDADARNEKFIPVLLEGVSEAAIPQVLRAWTYYRWPADSEALLRRLLAQPKVVPAPLGPPKRFD
ncbi:MAG TPA: SEFIR domain-containing protein [Enhygromyxa sp.]|nr:SEFIR domain-containing protein [Enhygromyxa sp.]